MAIETNPIIRSSFSEDAMAALIIFFHTFGKTKGSKPSIIKTKAIAAINVVSNMLPQKRWESPPLLLDYLTD